MERQLQVGIVGANARPGRLEALHLKAISELPGFKLAAVASREGRAAETAAAFGAGAGYADPQRLLADPSIDIVTVVGDAPARRDVLLSAIEAGKAVYADYPAGRDTAEALELAAAAQYARRTVAVGLQMRASPAAAKARELIALGAIGRVRSAAVTCRTRTPAATALAEGEASGANPAIVQGAHMFDTAIAVLGPLTGVSAMTFPSSAEVDVEHSRDDDGDMRCGFRQLLAQARLTGGQAISFDLAVGRPSCDRPFEMIVVGETGALRLCGGAPEGVQFGRLRLSVNDAPVFVDEGEAAALPDAAANVALVYGRLRDRIRGGVETSVDFEHALRLALLMNDILRSSRDQSWKSAHGWPEG
ncbi:MAG: Gfo/Idh/MocA family oxidoreductase [Hansschlegelia sp.]